METQDEEYICSDCGSTVPANAEFCQNCGASLVENSEEEITDDDGEELIEIPLTSEPAKLSAILSLLDEKKIDYSINENPMENIWGPTFSQVPRLLISKSLEDEAYEIIESIDEEEIEVLDTIAFNDGTPEEEKKKEKVKGIEGYLLVLSLLLILGPIAYLPYYIFDFFQSQNYLSRYPVAYTIVVLDLLAGLYISFFSVRAGVRLYNVKPGAVLNAIGYFNLFIAYQIIGFLVVGFSLYNVKLNSETIFIFDLLISETISSIVYAIVAKLYLKNSERVKNTFSEAFEFNNK